jgi:hypothetical protein
MFEFNHHLNNGCQNQYGLTHKFFLVFGQN